MEEQNFIESELYKETILEGGYGKISREIMRDKTISRDAKALYAYFISFAGSKMEAFPGWKLICAELGFKSKDTYYKYVTELKEKGLISVRQEKDGHKFAKNIYTIAFKNQQIETFKEKYAQDTSIPKKQESISVPNFSESENLGTVKVGNRKNQEPNINTSLNININNNEDEASDDGFSSLKNIIIAYEESRDTKSSTAERKILLNLCKAYTFELVEKAIEVMVEKADKPSLAYVRTTLIDWNRRGITTPSDFDSDEAELLTDKQKANENRKKAIKRNAQDKGTKGQQDNFNNFEQRKYDYDDLEKRLLGWK